MTTDYKNFVPGVDPEPTTIEQFAHSCTHFDNEGVYMMFEVDISQELRDLIYATYSSADSAEPVREAMNKIGAEFNVQSLKDY